MYSRAEFISRFKQPHDLVEPFLNEPPIIIFSVPHLQMQCHFLGYCGGIV